MGKEDPRVVGQDSPLIGALAKQTEAISKFTERVDALVIVLRELLEEDARGEENTSPRTYLNGDPFEG